MTERERKEKKGRRKERKKWEYQKEVGEKKRKCLGEVYTF